MDGIKNLMITIKLGGASFEVGEMVLDNRTVYFRYNPEILRLAAFNVFAHNRDDHSKNFSFLMDGNGHWKLAPAYDLTYSTSAYGFHSTMVAGESKNPQKHHLMQLAKYYDVKNPEQIFEQVQGAIAQWDSIAKDCGVSSKVSKEIKKHLAI